MARQFSYITEYALLGVLSLLWGSSYTLMKVAVAEIPPLSLIAIRVLIAGVVLWLVVLISADKFPRDRRTIFQLFIQSFLNSFGAWTLLAWGQQHIDSSMAAVLNSTSPLFAVFISLLLLKSETVIPRKVVGAAVAFFGVVLVVGVDVLQGLGSQVAGQLAALVGAAMYACAALYGRRFSSLPASVTAASTMLWAIVITVPAAIIVDQPWTLTPSLQAIIAVILLSLFSTALALLIYFRLLRTLGSIGTTSQAYLRAGVGVLLGVVLLGEQFTPVILLGLTLALLGVVMINYRGEN